MMPMLTQTQFLEIPGFDSLCLAFLPHFHSLKLCFLVQPQRKGVTSPVIPDNRYAGAEFRYFWVPCIQWGTPKSTGGYYECILTNKYEIVLDLVMSYLPIKDCVRTSILSSKWRSRWTNIPSLVFDETCCPSSCAFNREKQTRALANVVNRVLSQCNSSIQVFKFKGPYVAPYVDCWIFRVSKDPIETLSLDLRLPQDAGRYALPSSLFTCGSLSSLELVNCLLRPPSSFKGFENLKCLNLENVTLANDALEKVLFSCPLLEELVLNVQRRGIRYQLPASLFTSMNLSSLKLINCSLRSSPSFMRFKNLKCLELECFTLTNDALEKLISSCPLLEKLTLNNLKEADNLMINAPNLQHIHIDGNFVSINFGCAMTRLAVIYIDAPKCAYASLLDSLIKFPSIQQLELRNCHMEQEYKSGDAILDGIPFQCKDVYRLAISMDFCYSNYGGATLYLYRSLSKLTRKQIAGWRSFYLVIELGSWEDNSGKCHSEFGNLRSVKFDKFRGVAADMRFAEFVLENSPVLEEMTVNPYSDGIAWRNIKRLYELKRASTKAKITFDGSVSQA